MGKMEELKASIQEQDSNQIEVDEECNELFLECLILKIRIQRFSEMDSHFEKILKDIKE